MATADWDQEQFRQRVEANLAAGRFRLIVAVDAITEELKRTLRYLNEHSAADVQVLALELEYIADGDAEIVFPRTYGEELARPSKKRGRWDETALLRALEEGSTPEGFAAARCVWDLMTKRCVRFSWGTGLNPGVTGYLMMDGIEQPVLSVYAGPDRTSSVSINFEWMAARGATSERLEQLAAQIRKLPGASERLAGLEASGFKRRPGLPVETVLSRSGAVDQIEQTLAELASSPASVPPSLGGPHSSPPSAVGRRLGPAGEVRSHLLPSSAADGHLRADSGAGFLL